MKTLSVVIILVLTALLTMSVPIVANAVGMSSDTSRRQVSCNERGCWRCNRTGGNCHKVKRPPGEFTKR